MIYLVLSILFATGLFVIFKYFGIYKVDILENFKFNSGIIFTHTNRSVLAESGLGSVLFNALNMAPTFSIRDANGDFTYAEGLGNEVINPLAQIEDSYNKTAVDKISGNAGLSYSFLDNFTVQSNFQFNYSQVKGFVFRPEVFYGGGKVFNIF